MLLLLLPSTGCFIGTAARDQAMDRDRDGYTAWQVGGQDCDDTNPAVFPGAVESCLDEIDSDCDGLACWEQAVVFLEGEPAWATGSDLLSQLALGPTPRDFDGDGVLELLVSEQRTEEGDGRVLSWSLPLPLDALPLDAPEGLVRGSEEPGQGLIAETVGDLDGDGDEEIVVSPLDGELAYLLDALPRSRGEPLPGIRVPGHSTTDPPEDLLDAWLTFGAVQALGPWEGALGAFLLGAPDEDGGGYRRGVAYLFVGLPVEDGEVTAAAAAQATLIGVDDEDCFGNAMYTAADLNGDGRLDPMVLAPGYRPAISGLEARPDATGGIFGFTGPMSGTLPAESADLVMSSYHDNSRIGFAGSTGDINGDGYDDVGLYYGAGAGQLALFMGPIEGTFRPEQADTRLLGDAGEIETFGFAARWEPPGDVNADGYDDVLLAAPEEGTAGLGDGPPLSGAHYLFLGPLTGVQSPDHAHARWVGALENGRQSASVVADIDQDGTADLLLGAEHGAGAIHLISDAFSSLTD